MESKSPNQRNIWALDERTENVTIAIEKQIQQVLMI